MDPASEANLGAFLAMVRACEGTAAPNGFRYLFGSTPQHEILFDDMSDHPRREFSFRETNGQIATTSAAGAFQIEAGTWDDFIVATWPTPFDEAGQTACARWLIAGKGALDAVGAGEFQEAVDRCAPIWASLPGSMYPQPVRSLAFAKNAYTDAGGIVA